MFDTTMIGAKIKQARIEKNMTQLNLADAMGVSYQAVSNWERGNSMPDISKLGDLCAALGLTVNQLLGLEENIPSAVKKAVNQEELTMEELVEVAPILKPEEVKEQVEEKRSWWGPDLSFLEEGKNDSEENGEGSRPKRIRVFLKGMKDTLEKRESKKKEKKTKKLDISRIAELAPYLDQAYLDSLVMQADLSDLDDLDELAPFLSSRALDYLAEQVDLDDLDELMEIAPFFSDITLNKLARRCEETHDLDALEELAPFLSAKTLDEFVDRYIEKDSDQDISDLYPHLSANTLRKLARYLLEKKDLDAMEEVTCYL